MFGVLRILQHGKYLRGTPFDLFGYTQERKSERAWIKDYEDDINFVEKNLDSFSAKGLMTAATQLLQAPKHIRGFGHVKDNGMTTAAQQRDSAHKELSGGARVSFNNAA